MRQGFRVIDSDTHVNPSLDVLLRYADEALKARIDDLQPYRRTVKTVPGRGDAEDVGSSTILSIRPVRLQRVAGQKSAPAAQADGDRGFLSGRTQMVTRQPITPRVAEDNARGRLRDMDLEGRDIDFIIPGPWAYGAPALAPHLAQGLYRAYHRYMADYCAADSRRLKSMILALATDPVWSAQVIKEHAREDWVAAVWPLLPEGMPIDDPDLEPICRSCITPSRSRRRTFRAIATSGTTRRWVAAPAKPGAVSASSPSCSWEACWTATHVFASARWRAATAGCLTGSCA